MISFCNITISHTNTNGVMNYMLHMPKKLCKH